MYKCSTYTSSRTDGERQCWHNWVERDVCLWFAVNAIKQLVEQSAASRAELEKAIRHELQTLHEHRQSAGAPQVNLIAKLSVLQKKVKDALREKIDAAEGVERHAAEAVYKELLVEARAVEKQIAQWQTRADLKALDVDAEVTKTLEKSLNNLHLFLERIPEGRLRKAFNNLGVRLVVRFEHPSEGRRKACLSLPS